MRALHLALMLSGFALAACAADPPPAPPADQPRARIVQAKFIELRYELPEQKLAAGQSSAERWELGAPVEAEIADPNRIVYDEAYMRAYVHWAVTAPIACGAAEYTIVTPAGERKVSSGLDEVYLGRRFRAEDLVKFLQARASGKRVERTFRIENAEAVKVLRDHPGSTSAKRLRESPWERDTRSAAELLGLARYEPARPVLVALAKDGSPGVHYPAIIALGRVAAAAPEPVDDLVKLLDDEQRRSIAADALAFAGKAATPALIRALDHPNWKARNHVVYSLGRMDQAAASPVLNKALSHSDAEVRHWSVAVVGDLISRGGAEMGKPYVAGLAERLAKDESADTRRGAALALLKMQSLAAPAEEALRKASERKDESSEFARMALEAIQAAKNQP